MPLSKSNVVFISISDEANGAENVMLISALAIGAPIIFLHKVQTGGLSIPKKHPVHFIDHKSIFSGFIGLLIYLKNYKKGFLIISTHPYLNAYLGFLKRIGYLQSNIVVRECTSVFTRYAGFKKWSYKVAYWLGYPAVDLIVCQTDAMRDQFLENVKFVIQRKVIVRKNPIDLKKITFKGEMATNDPDIISPYICAAGRLIPEKGFSNLITAFNCIKSRHPGLKLLLLGEGPERYILSQLIKKYGLADCVILKGRINNPIPYFKSARLCIVSSIKEGFPNVLLEMMAVNPVVVSTLCAGGIDTIPGIIKSQVNDIPSLVSSIQFALNNNTYKQQKVLGQYLQDRNPEAFIESILQAL